jgi:hypothetical protein
MIPFGIYVDAFDFLDTAHIYIYVVLTLTAAEALPNILNEAVT